MKTKTCQFIDGTEVFKGQSIAWEIMCNSSPRCSWGDNNRTMVTPDVIIDALEDSIPDEGEEENQVNIVLERLKGIPEGVYVDLEN